jgi:hypothetical protein
MRRLRFICSLLAAGFFPAALATGNDPVSGHFNHEQCIACHQRSDAPLVAQWQRSAHASIEPVALCTSCHGSEHETAAASSRRNASCIDCHGGAASPAVHSYSSSKHGAIMQLEHKSYDWNRPLREANYRAPGCAYCHMYDGNHLATGNAGLEPRNEELNAVISACMDCHGARYITRLNANAEAMIRIGRMKLREARQLVADHGTNADPAIQALTRQMEQHLRNVYLGAYHQSPDYQWWHGQPALDGDLIRIRGLLDATNEKTHPGSTATGDNRHD